MSGARLFCVILVCTDFSRCSGITSYENEKDLIGEEERRGVTIKEDGGVNDQKHSGSTKRGLWIISQHQQPSEYESSGVGGGYHGSSGPGGYGYTGPGAYGFSGNGYNYASSGGGGYYRGPSFEHGYGYSGGGSSFGHGGADYEHINGHGGADYEHISGHGDSGHEVSQGHSNYNKLALKKLLIPLAGLAILGAAAALSTNPVLLQLGTVQSGRRKRSASSGYIYPPNPWTRPDKFI